MRSQGFFDGHRLRWRSKAPLVGGRETSRAFDVVLRVYPVGRGDGTSAAACLLGQALAQVSAATSAIRSASFSCAWSRQSRCVRSSRPCRNRSAGTWGPWLCRSWRRCAALSAFTTRRFSRRLRYSLSETRGSRQQDKTIPSRSIVEIIEEPP